MPLFDSTPEGILINVSGAAVNVSQSQSVVTSSQPVYLFGGIKPDGSAAILPIGNDGGLQISLSGTNIVTSSGVSTDNALVRWDGTTGTVVQNSNATLTDAGVLTLNNNLIVTGSVEVSSDVIVGGTLSASVGGDLSGSLPNPSVVDLTISGQTQGDILYFNGTNWVRLPAASTSDSVLLSAGAAPNSPRWVNSARTISVGTTSDPTTTNSNFTTVPEMSVSFDTNGLDVLINFNCGFHLEDNDQFELAIFFDGTEITRTRRLMEFNASAGFLGLTPGSCGIIGSMNTIITGVLSGSHTASARWRAVNGAARANGTERYITIMEIF